MLVTGILRAWYVISPWEFQYKILFDAVRVWRNASALSSGILWERFCRTFSISLSSKVVLSVWEAILSSESVDSLRNLFILSSESVGTPRSLNATPLNDQRRNEVLLYGQEYLKQKQLQSRHQGWHEVRHKTTTRWSKICFLVLKGTDGLANSACRSHVLWVFLLHLWHWYSAF